MAAEGLPSSSPCHPREGSRCAGSRSDGHGQWTGILLARLESDGLSVMAGLFGWAEKGEQPSQIAGRAVISPFLPLECRHHPCVSTSLGSKESAALCGRGVWGMSDACDAGLTRGQGTETSVARQSAKAAGCRRAPKMCWGQTCGCRLPTSFCCKQAPALNSALAPALLFVDITSAFFQYSPSQHCFSIARTCLGRNHNVSAVLSSWPSTISPSITRL